MRNTIIAVLLSSLALVGCKGDKKKAGEEGAAKPSAGGEPAAGDDKGGAAAGGKVNYAPIDALVAAAKTGDDFTNVLMECGKLEINAATEGNAKLGEDATYREHCRTAPAHARAKMAIAESTPDKMSAHCLSANMNVEALVTDGIQPEENKKLLEEVNKACGM